RQEEVQSGRPRQYGQAGRARHALVCRQLWRRARRLHQDYLWMRGRAAAAPAKNAGPTRPARAPRRWIALCFVAPLLGFLALVYVAPFLGVAAWSVTLPTPGVGQYERLAADPFVMSVFLRTFRICAIVTALSVAGAYAIAYVWVRATPLQRR